ncbi:MAG: AAA family ATPase, partial [Thermoanaerobaculia bacterium]|nr:AAA family ATPase [Thermoanaerobaculia bacterium]
MLQFPYGLADFHRIRTQGYLYLDRTAHLHDLERLGNVLVFLRPRRFGKSLWLDTLRCYYDLRFASEFESLFGDLAIGREPTPLHNRYFVLVWDFSRVDPHGSIDAIQRRLNEYLDNELDLFLKGYGEHLPTANVSLREDAGDSLSQVLAAVRTTPYKLYLLIDEYDNFINEVMVRDPETYRALVRADGPVKSLFKSLKASMRGEGLERVFMTGITPVALNDLSSGFNIARDVSRHPSLATLCGFTETEIRGQILEPMVQSGSLDAERIAETMRTLHEWYNGYIFSPDVDVRVLNPTNCLHLLQELQELGRYPRELHDRNLAMDRAKLAFLSQAPAGERLITELTMGDGIVDVPELVSQISLEDLVTRLDHDRHFLASFLYYLGLLTFVGDPAEQRLGIPNLVARKIYLERLLELRLPATSDRNDASSLALRFFRDGELEPLARFVETKLLAALSNRDSGGMRELAFKTLLLALLFDDQRYLAFSELEASHGHADLCLLRRALPTTTRLFDLLFELKLVPGKTTGLDSAQLAALEDNALRALPP